MMLFRSPLTLTRCTRQRRCYSTLFDTLKQRGLLQKASSEEQFKHVLEESPQTVYLGIDPSASALHIGHLIPLMSLLHFHLRGHHVISLVGGATGIVGDPSGRKTERKPADVKLVESNVTKLEEALRTFFARGREYAGRRRMVHSTDTEAQFTMMNNLDWHKNFNMLDFLRTVGLHARVNTMLSRESVKIRLDSNTGISFTEFTYQLLQAYDFHFLHQNHSCKVQIGGSDQWGNIVAGLELIGRMDEDAAPAFGFTTPLLTTASGEKFGKSAGNPVWLEPQLTSLFDFYQYFIKVEDADVEKYLRMLTLMPEEEITTIMHSHRACPEKRVAQTKLADEVTELVHSLAGVEKARAATEGAFGDKFENASKLLEAFKDDPRLVFCDLEELTTTPLIRLASKYKLVPSTGSARRLITSKGLYLNGDVVSDLYRKIDIENDMFQGRVAIIRAGKDKLLLLAIKL